MCWESKFLPQFNFQSHCESIFRYNSLIKHTLLWLSIRAWILPSRISVMSSSSNAPNVVLKELAMSLKSAEEYGLKIIKSQCYSIFANEMSLWRCFIYVQYLKYWTNDLLRIIDSKGVTWLAKYISSIRLSFISSNCFRHLPYLDS